MSDKARTKVLDAVVTRILQAIKDEIDDLPLGIGVDALANVATHLVFVAVCSVKVAVGGDPVDRQKIDEDVHEHIGMPIESFIGKYIDEACEAKAETEAVEEAKAEAEAVEVPA